MAEFPRLPIEIELFNGDDVVDRVIADLAPAVAETLRRNPRRFDAWIKGDILVRDVAASIPSNASAAAWRGDICLVGFAEKVLGFVETIGGLKNMDLYVKTLDRVRSKTRIVEEAEKELAAVRAARFSSDFKAYGMFYAPHTRDDYVSDPADAYDSWGWDTFEALDPRPKDAFVGDPPYEAWSNRYQSWKRQNAPLFVYGTTEHHWGGIDPAELRQALDEDGIDLDMILDNAMVDHHEDARESIVDEPTLWDIVEAWTPHAGTGSPEDLSLEDKVAAWNAKQTIVSYMADETVILPAFVGVTFEDCVTCCERRVESARKALAGAENWPPSDQSCETSVQSGKAPPLWF